MIIFTVGGPIAHTYEGQLDDFFGQSRYQTINISGNEDGDYEYFKSDFNWYKDGKRTRYDDEYMRMHSLEVARKVGIEGAALLKNEGAALPLSSGSKISLFGIGSRKYNYCANGSGHLTVSPVEDLKTTLEYDGLLVNKTLWDFYGENTASYGITKTMYDESGGVDPGNYSEYHVAEIPWTRVESNSSSFAEYGDAAIMIVSRDLGEGSDGNYYNAEHLNNDYLDLTIEEAEVIQNLCSLKNNGTFKKVILLLNTPNAMQFKSISQYNIDSIMYVGHGGNATNWQLADLLSGYTWPGDNYQETPSGKLVDTYLYDNKSGPSYANFGDFKWTSAGAIPSTTKWNHSDSYVVYQEGIYVGYRYYETRYEDAVLGRGGATSSVGATSGSGNWKYSDEVVYPFGHGLSYTTFSYSDYSVVKDEGGEYFEVSMKITNTGSRGGKEVLQVYVQKPYTQYDIDNKIEKSAIELVGFNKTNYLKPGESEIVSTKVYLKDLVSYDSYGAKTYLLEKGDYYIAVGTNAHNALNNILSAKGKTPSNTSNIMDEEGNSDFVYKFSQNSDADVNAFSVSKYTGNNITNQFDDVDINLYAGTADQHIVYLTRNNWQGTYPTSGVSLSCTNSRMVSDMQYSNTDPNNGSAIDDTGYSAVNYDVNNGLSLIDLMYDEEGNLISFNNPLWDSLLDQLSWREQCELVCRSVGFYAGATSISYGGANLKDGPVGIGVANPTYGTYMAFPNEQIQAGTFNLELEEEMGNAFGMEILHSGAQGVFGPGANMHRSPYSGRNWEYFSEDPYIASQFLNIECKGLTSRGAIVEAKHFALNDQERNRYGLAVFANEQTIREIYLRAFQTGIEEGNVNGMMSSFSRIGCTWAGRHAGLLTGVLRNEWGYQGFVETDAAVGMYMNTFGTRIDAVLAGQDNWMGGGYDNCFEGVKNNKRVQNAIRTSAKRILYSTVHSCAMNGIASGTRIIKVTPAWENVLDIGTIVTITLTSICASLAVLSFALPIILGKKGKKGGK